MMFKKIYAFLADENGYTLEALIWLVVLALGSAAIAFGILAAGRGQGGNISKDFVDFRVPGSKPLPGESLQPSTGSTGAATGLQ
jgi:hypothetical protein